jgi:hypothetical protein
MDTDFWKRQLDALLSAPVPTLFFLAVGAIAAWWLRGSVDKGEINGLRARVNVLEERLRLAADQAQTAVEAKERLAADLEKLQKQIGAGASKQALETTTSSAKMNLDRVMEWAARIAAQAIIT